MNHEGLLPFQGDEEQMCVFRSDSEHGLTYDIAVYVHLPHG
jgi:hypothetical protein